MFTPTKKKIIKNVSRIAQDLIFYKYFETKYRIRGDVRINKNKKYKV